MLRRCPVLLGAVLCTLQSAEVAGHQLGESYLFLRIGEQSVAGRVEATLSDLDRAIGLDGDGDGKVSADEFEGKIEAVKSYVGERVRLEAEGQSWQMRLTTHEVLQAPLGRYGVVRFEVDGVEQTPPVIEVEYRLLFEQDPLQRGLVVVETNALTQVTNVTEAVSLVFTASQTRQQLRLDGGGNRDTFFLFLREGVWHIWIGLDHILFLLVLILPAVGVSTQSGWEPAPDLRSALVRLLKIVTLFTLAHSVTLSLAALDIFRLPSRLVESVIAVSILAVGINNIYPRYSHHVWWLIVGFGLFHGFGFANVLGHLGLQSGSLVLSLFAFNLGVELGQVAIIAIVFPVLFALRAQNFYRQGIIRWGSAVTSLVALYWLVERALAI